MTSRVDSIRPLVSHVAQEPVAPQPPLPMQVLVDQNSALAVVPPKQTTRDVIVTSARNGITTAALTASSVGGLGAFILSASSQGSLALVAATAAVTLLGAGISAAFFAGRGATTDKGLLQKLSNELAATADERQLVRDERVALTNERAAFRSERGEFDRTVELKAKTLVSGQLAEIATERQKLIDDRATFESSFEVNKGKPGSPDQIASVQRDAAKLTAPQIAAIEAGLTKLAASHVRFVAKLRGVWNNGGFVPPAAVLGTMVSQGHIAAGTLAAGSSWGFRDESATLITSIAALASYAGVALGAAAEENR